MCGIVGIVNHNGLDSIAGSQPPLQAKMLRALEHLARRGPDGEGTWRDQLCWLGHRRLSIIDLSDRGNQPMQRGSFVISFNGMIYNYRSLRDQLQGLGHKFTSGTDTEVILAGWQQWGQKLLPRLTGMFAFALWNTETQEMCLVRDRFGKKPLFWRRWKGGIAFGSRLDAVEALSEAGELSKRALAWLLTLKYIPEPMSAVAEINKVPPGYLIEITPDKLKTTQWYITTPDAELIGQNPQDAAVILHQHVMEAVADRLVADVPIACFLSGGIDSAIIAAAARKIGNVDTFTVGLDVGDDTPWLFDERQDAKKTATFLGTTHHETVIRPHDALDQLDRLLGSALDEPFGDSSALPSMIIANAMRQQATVALSGDGADEVFGGYRKYRGELLANKWQPIPKPIRSLITKLVMKMPGGRTSHLRERIRQAQKFLYTADMPTLTRHANWMQITDQPELERALGDLAASIKLEDLIANVNIPQNIDPLSALLLRDIAIVLSGDMLTKIDRTSMEQGLEVRSPFLDHRVVEASLAIDGSQKVSLGAGKKILRDAFRDDLPASVFKRSKRGFEIPLVIWLQTTFSDKVSAALDPDFLEANNIAPQMSKKWRLDLEAGSQSAAERIWTLMSIQRWQLNR